MMSPTAFPAGTEDARRITLRLLGELFGAVGDRQAGFRLWDGALWPDAGPRPVTVVLQHPGALRAAEDSGFEVRDVECLREHYALTLRHWVRRLEASHGKALEFVDEPTYRVWRLFMSGSAHGFAHGRLNVYQALLVRPGEGGVSGLPLTRADWYARDQ